MLMIVVVYALFDRKTREYGLPIVARNDATMCRDLLNFRGSGAVQEKYPEDFDLYSLGEMNTETGRITPGEELVFVNNLKTILNEGING